MEEQAALDYLRLRCMLPDLSQRELATLWCDARFRLGSAMPGAGRPDIQEIPSQHAAYLEGVRGNPRYTASLVGPNASFKLVEIDPLLSYQFHIAPAWSVSLAAPLTDPSALAELLLLCLPHSLEDPPGYQVAALPNGFCIRTTTGNVRVLGAGQLGTDAAQQHFAGIAYGPPSNLVQVARFDGRYYLRNGYHRAYGLRKAGATHVPCVLVEATDYAQLGFMGGALTFERDLLESPNPPTLGHFTQDRAFPLQLRTMTRIITVTWSEYTFLEA